MEVGSGDDEGLTIIVKCLCGRCFSSAYTETGLVVASIKGKRRLSQPNSRLGDRTS